MPAAAVVGRGGMIQGFIDPGGKFEIAPATLLGMDFRAVKFGVFNEAAIEEARIIRGYLFQQGGITVWNQVRPIGRQ